MKNFATTYNFKGTTYSCFIYAKNALEALEYARRRNIGETIIGVAAKAEFELQPLPSELYKERKLHACAHTLSFYSWIAARAKVIDPVDDLLSDSGTLHEVLHELEYPDDFKFQEHLYRKMQELEALIPGLKTYKPTHHDTVSATKPVALREEISRMPSDWERFKSLALL